MNTQTITTTINAPRDRVWDVMLADETYREWTSIFNPGSYFQGSWGEGDTIRFLGPSGDGTAGGLLARITDSRRGERVSILYTGLVTGAGDDTESEFARTWSGLTETYSFAESDGVTTLTVELGTPPGTSPEVVAMLAEMATVWPQALATLTSLVEQTSRA